MSITTDLDEISNDYEQADIVLKHVIIFRDVSERMIILDAEIQSIVDDTKFDEIPASIKQSMNQYWQLVKQFNAGIVANSGVSETLGWVQ
jgi:hypothetical protein